MIHMFHKVDETTILNNQQIARTSKNLLHFLK